MASVRHRFVILSWICGSAKLFANFIGREEIIMVMRLDGKIIVYRVLFLRSDQPQHSIVHSFSKWSLYERPEASIMKELSVCSRVQLSVRGSHIIKAKMVLSKMQLQACFRFCCSKCDYGNQLHLSFNGFVCVFLFYIYS